MRPPLYQISASVVALLGGLALPKTTGAAEPHCEPNPPPALQPGDLDLCPVFERLGWDMVNNVPIYGDERSGLWNGRVAIVV